MHNGLELFYLYDHYTYKV